MFILFHFLLSLLLYCLCLFFSLILFPYSRCFLYLILVLCPFCSLSFLISSFLIQIPLFYRLSTSCLHVESLVPSQQILADSVSTIVLNSVSADSHPCCPNRLSQVPSQLFLSYSFLTESRIRSRILLQKFFSFFYRYSQVPPTLTPNRPGLYQC